MALLNLRMPRRKPYHPYRNIRLNRRPQRQQPIALNPIHIQQHNNEDNSSGTGFAIIVILLSFAMIIGGLAYMLTQNTTDVEMLKSLAK